MTTHTVGCRRSVPGLSEARAAVGVAGATRGYRAAQGCVHVKCIGEAMQAKRLLGTERNAPPHFAGRANELRELATYADYVFGNSDPSGGIVLIDGVPGPARRS